MKFSCKLAEAREQRELTEQFHCWVTAAGEPWLTFHATPTGFVARFPGLADFEVREGADEVICTPALGTDASTCDHLFVNQVVPADLSTRGELVFHASAVEIGAGAVAFVGPSGRGKSTLAASFARAGRPFLCDDGLHVRLDNDAIWAEPGPASIRLWDDSRAHVGASHTLVAQAARYTPKFSLLAGKEIPACGGRRPLLRAYFLGDDETHAMRIRPISGREAFLQCVRHSFFVDRPGTNASARQFQGIARLLDRVPCLQLDFPRRFDQLARVRDSIVENAS